MNAREVLRELRNVCKRLSKLIIDVNFLATENAVTWADYLPGIQNHVNYLYEYRSIIDYRQFSILLKDGGALQFYYRFENGELVTSRQCYYPPPFDPMDEPRELDFEVSLDELFSIRLQGEGDEPEQPFPYRAKHWSHIRLDFDAAVTTHDPSHLQYSAVNAFRIPADKVLSPFVFIDMVLRDFYPTEHAVYAAKAWYQPMLTQSARCGLASRIGRIEAVRISCP